MKTRRKLEEVMDTRSPGEHTATWTTQQQTEEDRGLKCTKNNEGIGNRRKHGW